MTARHKATGTFSVTGVGQSIIDLKGVTVPLSGEVRVDGFVRQATVRVFVPNELVAVLFRMLDKPIEQIPMYRPGLVGLNLKEF